MAGFPTKTIPYSCIYMAGFPSNTKTKTHILAGFPSNMTKYIYVLAGFPSNMTKYIYVLAGFPSCDVHI